MTKVLYLPLNGGGVQQGMYDAWNKTKVDLYIYDFLLKWDNFGKNRENLIKDLLEVVSQFRPDLIHMQLQLTGIFTPETFIEVKKICPNVIITNWTGDIRNIPSHEMIVLSPYIDYTLISSTGQLEAYEKAGCKNVKYWQIGYNPQIFFPKFEKNFKYDLVFTGNAYHPTSFTDCQLRLKILESLKKTLGSRFGLFGSGYSSATFGNVHSISPSEVNNLYNSSLSILSVSHYNDVSHYFSDRLLICLASGRPTISYRFPGYNTYFTKNCDLLIANNVEQILSQIDFCKKNIETANSIGINGYRKVRSEHTYYSRVVELLKMVGLR